jgi:hypothetical protein
VDDTESRDLTLSRSTGRVLRDNLLTERRAPIIVAGFLLIAYVSTLAPGVTYWDAGEFLAAIRTLGIPHPPGTPLYILVANVWSKALGPLLGFALSVNLFSAVCTAMACGAFVWLMIRWTRRPLVSAAGGMTAGVMSSVWLNATETEVYAPSLLVSALLLLVAQKAVETRQAKWFIMLAYLSGLGWSLQLSALVAAPAAFLLAFGIFRGERLISPPLGPADNRKLLDLASYMLVAAMLGASAVLFMLVRARYDPAINQGNPATLQGLVDVIARRQYRPVALFPRQAPLFIQIGNLFEYADWQIALGLAPNAPPSWLRTPFTIVFAALGVIGGAWHRRADKSSWRVLLVLFLTATLGVIAYLNMKAGPSYGEGFLAAGAKHEARERDYFFALGFVCWGMWAGAGAICAFARLGRRTGVIGLAVAILPFFLNRPAVDRSNIPAGTAPIDSAGRILHPAQRNAVVFAYGDNDTYPVWYAQQVEHTRRDVTVITIPLLGATWYRAELARRYGLLSPEYVRTWRGVDATIAAIVTAAVKLGRPVQKPPRGLLDRTS